MYPEEELAELRKQIGVLLAYAEYDGAEVPSLAILQDIHDPDLNRIGLAIDRLQVFRIL